MVRSARAPRSLLSDAVGQIGAGSYGGRSSCHASPSQVITSESLIWWKSWYHSPTARNSGGCKGHTISSTSAASLATVSGGRRELRKTVTPAPSG